MSASKTKKNDNVFLNPSENMEVSMKRNPKSSSKKPTSSKKPSNRKGSKSSNSFNPRYRVLGDGAVTRLDSDTETGPTTLTQIARRKPEVGVRSKIEKVRVLGPGYAVPISSLMANSAVRSGKKKTYTLTQM